MGRLRRAARLAGELAIRTIAEFFDDGCPQRAAAISYYAVLSLFPLAILAVAAFGLLFDDHGVRQSIIGFLVNKLPLREGDGRTRLAQILESATSEAGGFGAVGAAGLLFAASGVMGAVRQALNAAWDVRDPRPPLQGKLVDLALVLGFGVLLAASFALTLAVRLINSLGGELAGLGWLGHVAAEALTNVAQPASALLTFLVVMVLFWLVPARDARPRNVWPGALFVAVSFELAKTGFALYLESAGGYGAVYASLAAVVAFMVFVFVAANVLLLGGEMASEWRRVRAAASSPPARDGAAQQSAARRVLGAVRSLFVRSSRPRARR